jgi:hypothetical protein
MSQTLIDAFLLSFPVWALLLMMLMAIIVVDAIDN